MAFTASGTYTGAALIRENYVRAWEDAVFLNNQLAPIMPPPEDSGGGTKYGWLVHMSPNNSVEIFTENAIQPAAGNQGWVQCYSPYVYFRGLLQATGHAKDAMRSNWVNGLDEEAVQLTSQIADLWTTTFMGSTYGLQNAILATGSYAGQTRGSITWFEAYTAALSDYISYSTLMTTYRTMRAAERGARPDLILCPWNQKARIYNITGQPAAKYIGPADAAADFDNQSFASTAVMGIADMTTTVIFMLDRSPGYFKNIVHRPWQVKDMGPSGDSDLYQISYAGLLVNRNPIKQAQLTACTA
jgi:hypothetical protein